MAKYVDKYKNESGFTTYYIAETSCCKNRIEWGRGEGPEACPFCGDKYYKKPNLENKLFHLQDAFLEDYYKTGSVKILGEKMFPLIKEYAENMIKGLVKGRKSLPAAELEVRAWDAASMLVEKIMEDPQHRMLYSFGGYLGSLCKSVCYSTKNHDRSYSLNSILRGGTELGETVTASLDEITGGFEKNGEVKINNAAETALWREDVIEKMAFLVEKTARVLYGMTGSYGDKILYMQGLLLKFEPKKVKTLEGFFEKAGPRVKEYVEKGAEVIYEELKALAF